MIERINSTNNLAFKARFVNDSEGNFNYLLNQSRGMIDKKELDFFSKKLPDHDVEVSNLNIDKNYHINGVSLYNHDSCEYKYINTKDVPNVVVLNNVIKKLNSLYREDRRFNEKNHGIQRGFFVENSYYAEIHKNLT